MAVPPRGQAPRSQSSLELPGNSHVDIVTNVSASSKNLHDHATFTIRTMHMETTQSN